MSNTKDFIKEQDNKNREQNDNSLSDYPLSTDKSDSTLKPSLLAVTNEEKPDFASQESGKKSSRVSRKLLRMIGAVILIVVVVVAGAYVRNYLENVQKLKVETEGSNYASMVPADNPALVEFKKRYPQAEIILACPEDISNDGLQDLVVISIQGNNHQTIALIDDGAGSWKETPPIPAPQENPHIRFLNFDNKDENEVLISGEKQTKVGYAIYRLINGEMIDLFGEGMEDCC